MGPLALIPEAVRSLASVDVEATKVYSQQAHLGLPWELTIAGGGGGARVETKLQPLRSVSTDLCICHCTLSWPWECETYNFLKTEPCYLSVAGLELTV